MHTTTKWARMEVVEDTFESSSEDKLTQIGLRYTGWQDATYSEHVDAPIEWQFWVYEQYINELLKPFLKLGKARLP